MKCLSNETFRVHDDSSVLVDSFSLYVNDIMFPTDVIEKFITKKVYIFGSARGLSTLIQVHRKI